MKQTALLLVLVLVLLCVAGCAGGKKRTTGADAPADATTPTAAEGVEDWEDTDVQQPSTQSGSQTDNQTGSQTGNQTDNQTGSQTDDKPGNQQQPEQSDVLTWEAYNAMSTSQQQAYFKSFADPDEFYAWKDAAEKDYAERHKNDTVSGDGTLDLGDFAGR